MITVMSYLDIIDWLEQSSLIYDLLLWHISDPWNRLVVSRSELSIEIGNSVVHILVVVKLSYI